MTCDMTCGMTGVQICCKKRTFTEAEALAVIRSMAEKNAVCLYESPRRAMLLDAQDIPLADAWTAWWEECASCIVSHAGAELRLEKTPFTREAAGRLLKEVDPGTPDAAKMWARVTSYVLRGGKNVSVKGKIVYKEYFQPNEDGMLLCRHSRTAGLAQRS